MGKNGRVGDVRQTSPEPGERALLRGARIAIRDGAIEFAGTDGAIPDAVLRRSATGTLSLGAAALGNTAITGTASVSSTLDVTGTVTAFGYLGVGGSSGITGALDVAGTCSGIWGPRDNGLIAASGDPDLQSGLTLLTAGTVYLVKLPISRAATPTKLYWYVTTGATGATSSQNWVGVLDSTGALLGSSVGIDAASGSSGLKTTTIAPGALVANTFVWGAIVCNAGTTLPTLASGAATALTTLGNAGLTATGLRHATCATSQTTLVTQVPANNLAGPAIWMALGT